MQPLAPKALTDHSYARKEWFREYGQAYKPKILYALILAQNRYVAPRQIFVDRGTIRMHSSAIGVHLFLTVID